jgi:hypothetical protein
MEFRVRSLKLNPIVLLPFELCRVDCSLLEMTRLTTRHIFVIFCFITNAKYRGSLLLAGPLIADEVTQVNIAGLCDMKAS